MLTTSPPPPPPLLKMFVLWWPPFRYHITTMKLSGREMYMELQHFHISADYFILKQTSLLDHRQNVCDGLFGSYNFNQTTQPQGFLKLG